MTDEQTKEIRRRLDKDLSLDEFERDYRSTEEAATQFFQDLFVQVLNFEETPSPLGDATWQDLPVHEWPNSARANAARLFAKSRNFRIIYVELEKLTRTAERNAIQSLTRSDRTSGWAIEGSFLTVFHAPDEDVWHLVTPYEEGTDDITTGRPVLRRYTLGEGETHRTVSNALSSMDASKGRLAERIDEAFRVKPVTEDFYENYKNAFDTLSKELRRKGLEIEDADRYAHMTLNRLMFFYYLQKKGWIGDRKDFVRWFHMQYEKSDDEDVFHEKWLSALFFDGMNQPEGEEIDADLPTDVESEICELPYMNGGLFQPTEEDELDTFLSDAALNSVIRGFLEQYNFTVTEESPYDIDVAVDPAMLGKIYESLIAEQERGEAGIFYTPRVEVDLMCRMALYEQFCDYANNIGAEGKQRVVKFIFNEPKDWEPTDSSERERLETTLHDLRIVDPACGSGAFLVGMKQVLTELYRKLGTNSDYHLKEQIINENLYGVDIKDWAVRVAEFRLWLSLVEGEDQLPAQRPVLPNFSFKLKVGDSLIQKLDEEFVSLDSLSRTREGNTASLLTELKELKREHFEGERDNREEIEQKQLELVHEHIDGRIKSLSSSSEQSTLVGGVKDEGLDAETQARIDQLQRTKDAIDSAEDTGFFMWDIDFSEVMVDGGFDIVIGNPPYVRQENIIDQSIHPERLKEMGDERSSELRETYIEDLRSYVETTFDIRPYKGSDLYVYFYFRGVDILRESGTLTFICSNSWMDVKYGRRLQEGLLRFGNINHILDNHAGAIFDEADVNTLITSVQKESATSRLNGEVPFIAFNDHYENLVGSGIFESALISRNSDLSIDYRGETLFYEEFNSGRRVGLPSAGLWRLGGGEVEVIDSDNGSVFSEKTGVSGAQSSIESYSSNAVGGKRPIGTYTGDTSWSRYLKAPEVYFHILNQNEDLLVPINEVADVFLGVTTGANKFFYPNEELVAQYDGLEEYLHPAVKTPRILSRPKVTKEDLEHRILLLPEKPPETGVQEFIKWGEEQGYHSRPAVSGDPWYSLEGIAVQAQVFWQMTHFTEHLAYYSEKPLYLDKRMYGIRFHDGVDAHPKILAGLLNSTYLALVKLVSGRESSGRSLDTMGHEIEGYLIPDPREISSEEKAKLLDAFDQIANKESEAIYDEFNDPKRQHLDNIVFDILGISDNQKDELYNGVEYLIRQLRERDQNR